ncbi:unnamed protein product [Paramecium pentaurelia]|uniref:Uncharacterized protein n=1 Tax=Paramecium pentaurelia TaxID=43138 RepID=A0A8S1VTW0_9CILI|nr:unnamed protein product [Paramecium pentaurelia]
MDNQYNPFYNNSLEANRKTNFLASNGKRVVQEQKEQILLKEEKQRQEKAQQIEYERKLLNQEPVPVYLQRDDRQQKVTASERKEIIRNLENEANKNSDGGFFAKVFQQKDNKDQQKLLQKQAYIEEIQKQIDEKKRKKEDERQKKMEEDRQYEERIIKEREGMNQNSVIKDEDKKQIIKTIKNRHLLQQYDESKMIFNEFDEQQTNLTNNNIVPNYLKENLKEVDDKFEQDLKNKTNPHTPFTKLQSQRTLQDQNPINITYNHPNTAGNAQNNRSFRNNSQHNNSQNNQQLQMQYEQQQMQQQYLLQQQYFLQQQQQIQNFQQPQYYHQFEQKPIIPQLMERFQREFEDLKMMNRIKSKEQEEGIDKLREQIEMQSQMWNEDLRKLRAEVQISAEQKNKAFYELEHLKGQLKRQELFEEAQYNNQNQQQQAKQSNGWNQQDKKLITENEYQRSQNQSRQQKFEDNFNFYNSFEQE